MLKKANYYLVDMIPLNTFFKDTTIIRLIKLNVTNS
jgi:hypothetical protein